MKKTLKSRQNEIKNDNMANENNSRRNIVPYSTQTA